MPKLSLRWPIDLKGYAIKPAPKPTSKPDNRRGSILEDADPLGPSVIALGGETGWYDCMERDGMYDRLARCPANENGVLEFVHQNGFLKLGRTEYVDFICNEIRVVRSLLKAKQACNWSAIHRWMEKNRKIIRTEPVLIGDDPPQLFYGPVSLHAAVYLQFFEDLSTGANLKHCKRPGCREWFKYGSGTNHRSTAEYCSAKCQNADKYARRKEGGS